MKTAYCWVTAYRCALLESNPSQLSMRINEAQEAIDERLRRPIQIEDHEHRAIKDARSGLSDLDAEQVDRELRSSLRRLSLAVSKR